MKNYQLFSFLLFLFSLSLCYGSLELLHVITRHGKRTTYGFYPTDPYKNLTFYPMGLGGLLNDGKMQSYEVGIRLRKEYNCYLGPIYNDDIVYTMSTDYPRTRMTASLILAGLFPPYGEQKWHPTLNWQPIPVYTKPNKYEDIINPDCDYRKNLLHGLSERTYIQKKYLEPYKSLYKYIGEHSGMEVNNPHQLLEFFFIVHTEFEMGLKLPDWVMEIYPENITEAVSSVYGYLNAYRELKIINTGYLFKKIIDDMQATRNQSLIPKNTKMFLVAGHETTIGYILEALSLTEPHIPPYSSSLIFETHKDAFAEYFVKIKYIRGPRAPIEELHIYGCEELCPLKTFLRLTDFLVPTESLERACHGTFVPYPSIDY